MKNLSIRCSDIAGIRTPAEFYQKKFIHKPVQRDYFDIGTAAHAYILEPETWSELIVVAEDPPEPGKINKDGSLTKKGKNLEYLSKLKECNPSKIVFETYWYNQVIGYAESLLKLPGFDKLVNRDTGLYEHSMRRKYNDNITLTGTADYIKPGKFITDLKFMRDVSDFEINKAFKEFDYHLRAAYYLDLYNDNQPELPIDKFIYIMVSKSENPVARFIVMSEIDIQAGRSLYQERIEAIDNCNNSGDWILDSMENFQLAEWVYNKSVNF